MASRRSVFYAVLTAVFALPAAFFAFYGVQLVYAVVTFEGEGSLGHVGMYIAAVLFPALALILGALALLAWRKSRPKPTDL